MGGWRVLPSRSNVQDFSVAEEYIALALERFSQDTPAVLRLQKLFGYNLAMTALEKQQKRAERGLAQPIRRADECSMCCECETECPTEAFDADTGLSDIERCIECMRCVYIWPG